MSLEAMERLTVGVLLLLWIGTVAAATTTEKPAKEPPTPTTPSPPPPPAVDPFPDMELIDYVRSGAIIVAFLATAFAGQDIWFLSNIIFVTAFSAIFYLFPEPFISYGTTGKLDPIHMYMGQQFGAALLTHAVIAFFAKKSRHDGVRTAVLVSNLLGGAVLFQCMLLDYFKSAGDPQRLSEQALSFAALACGLWVLGNFVAVIRSGSFGGSTIAMKSALTKHVLIDLIFYTAISFYAYGYPEVALSNFSVKNFKPDAIHAHMVRSSGALAFGSVIYAFQALSFVDDKDKRAYLLGRLASFAAALPVGFLYQWRYQLATNNVFLISLGVMMLPILNAALGYFGPIGLPKLKRN